VREEEKRVMNSSEQF
jgi:ABC-type multidrug transport system ATPase subunit